MSQSDSALTMKAIVLNGKIVGRLDEEEKRKYVAQLTELADEMDIDIGGPV